MNSSLRLRLVIIILTPLVLIAGLLAVWASRDAHARAQAQFDQSLLSAALAISRDVALSGGDALSPETNALLRDSSNGTVLYHVYAPDGVFVTGYATPPVPSTTPSSPQSGQVYFDGTYSGTPVRTLRFSDTMQIDGLTGEVTVTVWQPTALRTALAREMSWRTFQVMAVLVLAVALIVWFGVRHGLRPLLALEVAIARRSPDDLTPIQRQIPFEARGIVAILNRLFGQLTSTIEAKDVFISNAAHQLRNPIAGVVAMSEAVRSARTAEDMQLRADELIRASRRTANLANKLLALDRAAARQSDLLKEPLDLLEVVRTAVERHAATAEARGVRLLQDLPGEPVLVRADRTMINEAITNLVENALLHGGDHLSVIRLAVSEEAGGAVVSVSDDGQGIPEASLQEAKARFGQVRPSEGSGLGLAIAEAVANQHGGALTLTPQARGLRIELALAAPTAERP